MEKIQRWDTKEDVIKDLAHANGLGTNFVDDSFIVRGARPPPPPRHLRDEDDELELRYGKFGSHFHESLKPDLQGISKMLRMVNEPQEKDRPEKEKPEETRIVICKLNPYVPEFVPKQDVNMSNKSDTLSNGITTSLKIGNASLKLNSSCEEEERLTKNVAENGIETEHGPSFEPSQNGEHTNRKICDQNDDDKQQDKSKMEAILKEKIIDSSKAKTLKEKRARNVAIVALLKLKSKPQSPITTSSSESKISRSGSPASTNAKETNAPKETLILHPPNFYTTTSSGAQTDNVTSYPLIIEPVNRNNEENNRKHPEEVDTSNLESAEVAKAVVNPEEQESIQKVMDWLNQPEKPKPIGPPHIGPINFKKKEAAPLTGPIVYRKKETKESSKSPVSETTSKKPIPSQPEAFVPSKHASDLAKKYEERKKANEERQLDMWSKLERDLKARDEVVKERLKAQNGSPNASRGSSRCSSRPQNHQ